MRLLKTTYIYLLALTIFPVAWLKEQPFAKQGPKPYFYDERANPEQDA